MPNACTENQLVEQPAIGLFAELGWAVAFANPHPGPIPVGEGVIVDELGLLGRETSGEVVLLSRLRAALEKLNASRMGHHVPPGAITAAVDELSLCLLPPRLLSGQVNLKSK